MIVPAMIEPQRFREVMSSFPSGVVVLTAFGQDWQPRGLTVSAFCAVSLEPPLALACIDKTSNTLPAVQHTSGFTANVLAAGREPLARRMATKVTDNISPLVLDENVEMKEMPRIDDPEHSMDHDGDAGSKEPP